MSIFLPCLPANYLYPFALHVHDISLLSLYLHFFSCGVHCAALTFLTGAPKNNTFDTRRVKAGLLDVEATAAKLGEKFGGEKGGAAAAQAGRAMDQGLKRLSVGVGKLGGGIGSFGRPQKSSASEANNNDGDDDDIEEQQQNEQQNEAPEEQESSESNSEQNTPSESSNEEFEDQQALEQWLRRIEDDPGELLRRKFRYQYRQLQLNGTANSIQNGGQIW